MIRLNNHGCTYFSIYLDQIISFPEVTLPQHMNILVWHGPF